MSTTKTIADLTNASTRDALRSAGVLRQISNCNDECLARIDLLLADIQLQEARVVDAVKRDDAKTVIMARAKQLERIAEIITLLQGAT